MFMHGNAKGIAHQCYTAHPPLDVSIVLRISVRSNVSLIGGSLIR